MIIGGHSHDPICVDDKGVWIKDYQPTQPCKPDFQNGTWIMQAFEYVEKYLKEIETEEGDAGKVFKNVTELVYQIGLCRH